MVPVELAKLDAVIAPFELTELVGDTVAAVDVVELAELIPVDTPLLLTVVVPVG